MAKKQTERAKVFKVAVAGPYFDLFDYSAPVELAGELEAGQLVSVPFGHRVLTGVIWDAPLWDEPDDGRESERVVKLKEIKNVLDRRPVFSRNMLKLLSWICRYYRSMAGEVFRMALPPAIVRMSEKIAVAAPQAVEIAERFELPDAWIEFVRELALSGGMTIDKCARLGAAERELEKLKKAGVVNFSSRLAKPKAREKNEKIYRVADRESAARVVEAAKLQSKRRALLEIMLETDFVSGRTLEIKVKDCVAALKKLEADRIVEAQLRRVYRAPVSLNCDADEEPREGRELTARQKDALGRILASVESGGFKTFLLHGVTGSGKTEVYIRACRACADKGKTALVMAPEIALTPQLLRRFAEEFGDRIALLHSGLSDGERFDEWSRARDGSADVVIGARSAAFAPLENVGLIVVDEEHEQSYKSEERSLYNARDAAVMRANIEGATAVLGSATPSLESWLNAKTGKYELLSLPERAKARSMPRISVVRLAPRDLKDGMLLSPELIVALSGVFDAGRQAMLFAPRRGFAPTLQCPNCGWALVCAHCDVSLVYHRATKTFSCHYCGAETSPPEVCENCLSMDLQLLGSGTEKFELLLANYFPQARLLRLDRDAIARKGELERILTRFAKGEADALVGTQIITKGHHFPNVTLSAALMADHSMNFPDFRAAERTFQILTQIAGRAGRGETPGEVIIQTLNPDHEIFDYVRNGDYEAFAEYELKRRRAAFYPPYSRLMRALVTGADETRTNETAERLSRRLKELCASDLRLAGAEALDATAAPVERIKDKFRRHAILKARNSAQIAAALDELAKSRREIEKYPDVETRIDVDPSSML